MQVPNVRLSTLDLDTLVAINRGQRHALAIVDDCRRRSGERLNDHAVHRALRRLRELGLIVECDERGDLDDGDPSRASRYRVTLAGQAVARAESQRLSTLLEDCRAAGF